MVYDININAPNNKLKPRAESRPRRQAFSARVVNDWNSLPQPVVGADSIEQFKSRLDAHWANIRYQVAD